MIKLLCVSLAALSWLINYGFALHLGGTPASALIALTASAWVPVFMGLQTLNIRGLNPLLRALVITFIGLTPSFVLLVVTRWYQSVYWVDFWLIAGIVGTFVAWWGLYLKKQVTPFSYQSTHGRVNTGHSSKPVPVVLIILATFIGVAMIALRWSALSGILGFLSVLLLTTLYCLYEWYCVSIPASMGSIELNNFGETIWMVLRPLVHQAYTVGVVSYLGLENWGEYLFFGLTMVSFCIAERAYRT